MPPKQPFDLLSQYQSPFDISGEPRFNGPVPQGNNLMQMLALLAPYFQEQARAQQNFLPQLVQASHAIKGGGRRDMSGNLMLSDPLAEKQRQDALWEATFTPEAERIRKERVRFQTPMDIPTFTERERAGVNARARMRYGGGGQGQTAAPTGPAATPTEPLAQLGSPAPTPPTQRMAPPALTPPAPEPRPAPGPPQAASVSPAFDINSLLQAGPQITPMVAENPPAYVTPAPGSQPPAIPYRYGTGTQPIPQESIMPNFVQPTPMLTPWEIMATGGYAPGAGFPRGFRY